MEVLNGKFSSKEVTELVLPDGVIDYEGNYCKKRMQEILSFLEENNLIENIDKSVFDSFIKKNREIEDE